MSAAHWFGLAVAMLIFLLLDLARGCQIRLLKRRVALLEQWKQEDEEGEEDARDADPGTGS